MIFVFINFERCSYLTSSVFTVYNMSLVHEFTVEMTCEGCSGAVSRVLGKLKGSGVDDFSIDLGTKKVTVISSMPADSLLEVLKKTGKEVTYVGAKS